jgi:opacity protein-like surface antigen
MNGSLTHAPHAPRGDTPKIEKGIGMMKSILVAAALSFAAVSAASAATVGPVTAPKTTAVPSDLLQVKSKGHGHKGGKAHHGGGHKGKAHHHGGNKGKAHHYKGHKGKAHHHGRGHGNRYYWHGRYWNRYYYRPYGVTGCIYIGPFWICPW